MSIIAVKNIPAKFSLHQLVVGLAKKIRVDFEAINFGPVTKKSSDKVCYLRLPDDVDPQEVIDAIQSETKYIAYMPKQVPNLPPSSNKGKIPMQLRKRMQLPLMSAEQMTADKIFVDTHLEILSEMQYKYTGLYNLSKKTGHKLLEVIARRIFQRLKQIAEANPELLESGFQLSMAYRKLHPHFGDFQLILSTLHRLQDAAGAPRAQIVESDLTAVSSQPYVIDNVPMDKVQSVCVKYTERINKKISEHIEKLDCKPQEGDSEDDAARKKVRQQLQNMGLYMPQIIRQVITNHFIPEKAPFQRMRIYGEPFLPPKEVLRDVLKRQKVVQIMRCQRMYNKLMCKIPLKQYTSFVTLDGKDFGGAKLVVRSSDIPLYEVPLSLISEMKAVFGVDATEEMEEDLVLGDEEEDEEDLEQDAEMFEEEL